MRRLNFSHLPKETLEAFKILSKETWLNKKSWYLAGGTALTLQLDHRVSFDLDFFTQEKDFDAEEVILSLLPYGFKTSSRSKGTLYGVLKGAKVSFIAYPYFIPKEPFIKEQGINILNAKDIAIMKIIAISQRSTKRDFFDLYWYINNNEPLIKVLKRVGSQFPKLNHNYHHIFKSLTYFDEAEENPDPEIFFNATWEQVKKYFLTIVPEIGKEIL